MVAMTEHGGEPHGTVLVSPSQHLQQACTHNRAHEDGAVGAEADLLCSFT